MTQATGGSPGRRTEEKSGYRRWSWYAMCMPQSNMIRFPPIVTTTQLFPTSCPAPARTHTSHGSGLKVSRVFLRSSRQVVTSRNSFLTQNQAVDSHRPPSPRSRHLASLLPGPRPPAASGLYALETSDRAPIYYSDLLVSRSIRLTNEIRKHKTKTLKSYIYIETIIGYVALALYM